MRNVRSISRVFSRAAAIITAAIVIAGCSGNGGPPSASWQAQELAAVSQKSISEPGGRIIGLSPDGTWLLLYQREAREFVIRDLSGGSPEARVSYSGASVDLSSFDWSPTGERATFTENVFRYLHDPDIWVIDLQEQTLANVTDDGAAGSDWLNGSENSFLDTVPTWRSEDELCFVRAVKEDDERKPYVNCLELPGGSPNEAFLISQQASFSIVGLRYLSSEGRFFYHSFPSKVDDPAGGIWSTAEGGDEPVQLLSSHERKGAPTLVSMSPDGRFLLVYYSRLHAAGTRGVGSRFSIVDVEENSVQELYHGENREEAGRPRLLNARLSPDGSKVVYTAQLPQQSGVPDSLLAIRDRAGGEPNVLYRVEEGQPLGLVTGSTAAERPVGLQWRRNDTILVSNAVRGESAILFEIGREE